MSELSQAEYLRRRYGAHQTDRRNIAIVAGLLVVLTAAWLVWQVIALRAPSASAEGVALTVVSDSEVSVTFNLTATEGSTVSCTVRAFTENLTEVGVKEVTVGPVVESPSSVTTSVATIQPATGATVGDCLILEE